ncbi:zinc finger protein OZF-like [Daktulosphaira vitifoliae]|uniref:zinc finger protein OZF-like n=1 Tax=Daktulosphaira vitifoliae TaxID=58002 RepID=UPI0021A9951A|nr:zinc finger protein OZF-like [Daktulosphaira vitifoliae]XP_050521796.1 zinc finger protein OZF-like [Daktulosphaira vitifoliae]
MPPVVDVEKVCRLCFREDDGHSKMTSIFERHELEDIIKKCVQIEVSLRGDEPTNVCASCILSLDSWNKFKILCDNTNAFLQQYIHDGIETELEFNSEMSNLGPLGFTPSQMSDLSIGLLENDSLWNSMSQQWNEGEMSRDSPLPKYMKKVGTPDMSTNRTESNEACVTTTFNFFAHKNDDKFKETRWWNPKAISMKTYYESKSKNTTKGLKLMTKYHSFYNNKYTCKICPESFTKFNDLILHDSNVHVDFPKNYVCKSCGKLFLSEERLCIHENIHREKLFECHLCLKRFTQKKTLDNHLNVHIGQFTCQICGYKSHNAHNLKIHENTHSSIKLHSCNSCKKDFSTKSSLSRHIRLVHQKNIMFRCNQCDYTTIQPSNLRYHKSFHNAQSFICHFCGKMFKNRELFMLHSKIHENPLFTCAHCNKGFRKKKNLKNHLSNNHGLGLSTTKLYTCNICLKHFSRILYLKKHQNKFH